MADLERLARQQRRAILDVDAQLASRLVDAYSAAWGRLRPQLDALTAAIQAARDAGEDVSAGWLAREERLRLLEHQITSEVTMIARSANGQITVAQWQAIHAAQDHAREAVTLALGPTPAGVVPSFNLLNPEAVRAIVGALGEGKPLTALLDSLGLEAAAGVKTALTDGVIVGEGPAAIARRARAAFGGNAVRAVTVARTETLRAYREGNRASYQASGVVAGWRWMAALTTRSCAYCWSQHGSVHPLNAPMATHPRCRCAMSPVLKAEFGGVDDVATGPEAFADLDADQQRAVLGGAKYRAYAANAIALEDLAGTKRTREWGRVGYEKSLTAAIGQDGARRYVREARA